MRRYALLALGIAALWVGSAWTAPDRDGERRARLHERGMGHLRRWMDERRRDVEDMAMMAMWTDSSNMTHMKMQEMYRGLPVMGGEMIMHMNADGDMYAMTDNMVPAFRVERAPRLTRRQAVEEAVRAYGCGECFTGKRPRPLSTTE